MQITYEERKKYIELFADKIYNNEKLNFLFPEPIAKFKQYAFDMFLNTDLTYEQITDSMTALIEQRKKAYEVKREQDIRDTVAKIYNGNEKLFYKSLEDIQNEYVQTYLNDNSLSIYDIENILLNTVKELKERQAKEFEKAADNPIVVEIRPEMVSVVNEPVVDNELNAMVDESSENKLEIVADDRQVTKVKKSNNSQTGSISLFSIGVSILAVTAFILIAMILNLLLK